MMNDKFPNIKKRNSNFVGREERYIFQYPIIMKYLEKKVHGWNIWQFFENINKFKVCVYADTEFTKLILEDYKQYKGMVNVKYMSDKNYMKYEGDYNGLKVLSPNELLKKYNNGKIEMIVICSIFHENEVFEELENLGFYQDALISINSVIFYDT